MGTEQLVDCLLFIFFSFEKTYGSYADAGFTSNYRQLRRYLSTSPVLLFVIQGAAYYGHEFRMH